MNRDFNLFFTLVIAVFFISNASAKSSSLSSTSHFKKDVNFEIQQQPSNIIVVTGRVHDEAGAPVIGATVKESKLASNGVITDVNGKFEIKITKGSLLTVSYVGYVTRTVEVKENVLLNIVMKEDTQALQEVVVTGYQTVKKQNLVGSVSTIKASDLVLGGTQTLEQSLQGRLSGVQVLNQSGLTGTRQTVRVRGTSTLMGNQEPVWVVDGIIQEDPLPFSTNVLGSIDNIDAIRNFVGGAISWLNPEDIEDLTVLKDASATAIYGVKAANGVIVITTKKGQAGRLSLTYTGGLSIGEKMSYNKLELMNSMDRVDASREAFHTGGIVGSEPTVGYLKYAFDYDRRKISLEEFNEQVKKIETVNTNWFDILFRTPISHNHTISISGGDSKATYRASFGVNDATNTAIGNDLMSYSGSLKLNAKFWNRMDLSLSLSGNLAETKGFIGTDPYRYALTTSRAIPAYDDEGELAFYDKNGYLYNILNELKYSGNENNKSTLAGNINMRLKIINGLTFSSLLGFNYASTSGSSWKTEQTWFMATQRRYNFDEYGPGSDEYLSSKIPYGGWLGTDENRNKNFTFRNQLEFARVFAEKHLFNAMAGMEMRSNKYNGYSQENWGYMPDRGKKFAGLPSTFLTGSSYSDNYLHRTTPKIIDRVANYISLYANMSYMFDERYSINSSIRLDASNRFGQDKNARYQPVWSTGVRWNMHKEAWMKEQKIVNNLSLRGSYGFQGNVVEGYGPDLVASLNPVDAYGNFTMGISRLPVPGLKWEKNKTVNLGLDFSLFTNRISGGIEYYDKKTVDMIVDYPVPLENGITAMPINGGNMRNYGWELSLNFVPVRTNDFGLSLGVTTGKVYNKLQSKIRPTGQWQYVTGGKHDKEGYPVSSFWAFRFEGLNPENGAPIINLEGADSEKGSQDITAFMDYAGKLNPDLSMGFNVNFRYKSLSVYSNLYLSTGNQRFLSSPYSNIAAIPLEENNMSSELLKRWRKPGDERVTNIPSLPTPRTNRVMFPFQTKGLYGKLYPYEAWSYSTARVVDAWFLRCNNINFSYQFPQKFISSFAQSLSLSLSVSNVFQIVSKDFYGRDPEVASGQQPMTSNYTLRINASF